MRARAAMAALIAVILAAAVVAMFHAPWYRVSYHSLVVDERVYALTMFDSIDAVTAFVALLVHAYFFARMLFTGLLLVVADGRTRVVAWYTPAGAHFQAGIALAVAIGLNVLPPHPTGTLFEPEVVGRGWGGPLLVLACLASHLVIHLIARNSKLARTQVWTDDEGEPLPKRKRWIRAPRQERPLVKSPPPLAPSSAVGGDPFRGGPATGIAARIVKPEPRLAVPRAENKDAPDPELLV